MDTNMLNPLMAILSPAKPAVGETNNIDDGRQEAVHLLKLGAGHAYLFGMS